jgi:hypothetical protein
MIFYEAKLDEKYQESCRGRSYNSTIQGQLELKWRLLTLYLQKIQTDPKVECVEESAEYATFYSENDRFYHPSAEDEDPSVDKRHLKLTEGVKEIFQEYVAKCSIENVYFLMSTKDDTNPLTNPDIPQEMKPRCCGKDWNETKRQFCWISNSVLEGCPHL